MGSYLFLTGGYHFDQISKVSVYCVDRDQWSLGKSLNDARSGHFSCTLSEKLYVCSGAKVRSIEVAECKDLIAGRLEAWQVLPDVQYKIISAGK